MNMQFCSNGIVFGCLTPEGKIDEKRVKSFVELAKGKETVFHKAIDEIEDIEEYWIRTGC